jgi:hypothetical protein
MSSIPDLIVYTRPGCGLCRDALETVARLFDARRAEGLAVPTVVERDISTDADWERAFFDRIPVIEMADHRLELVTGAARIRRLLADVLAEASPQPGPEAARPGG